MLKIKSILQNNLCKYVGGQQILVKALKQGYVILGGQQSGQQISQINGDSSTWKTLEAPSFLLIYYS